MEKFQLSASDELGVVALKVKDLPKMTQFYQKILGLQVVAASADTVDLGVAEGPLLKMRAVPDGTTAPMKTGLYHIAFLLPERKDLGNILHYFFTENIPLVGGADHGYSEALYLNDPEGNGLEIYRDKPMSDWDIRETGEVVGVTEELDGDSLLAAGTGNWQGFPAHSKVGHIHLKVADLVATENFYRSLGFSLKYNFGTQAKFFSTGPYHHHIGSNVWSGTKLPPMTEQDLGLDYFSLRLASPEKFAQLKQHLTNLQQTYKSISQQQLFLTDPNGIKLLIETV